MANGFILRPETIEAAYCSTAATGYRASYTNDDRMGLVWRSTTGSATQWLVLDLGADTALDTITLHGLTDALDTWQWAVELATEAQGRFTGSYWAGSAADLLAGATMPVSGRGRALWTAPNDAPAAARYVRLAFSTLADAAITVGRVCIGQRIVLGRNFTYGAVKSIRPLGSVAFSPRGVLLRRRGAKLRGVGVSCDAVTQAETEASVMPLYERVGNDETVVLCLDPTADDERQQRIWLGFLQGDLGSVFAGYDRFTCQFNVLAID